MTRLDDIKALLKNASEPEDWRFRVYPHVTNWIPHSDPVLFYVEGCFQRTGEQAKADCDFANESLDAVRWLVEQLEERERQLIDVMKTSDASIDKLQALADDLLEKVNKRLGIEK